MDFDKLIEPYNENGRTLALQINWLLKQGIPQPSVDYAISLVYKKLEDGVTFADGNALDQELRRVAKEHYGADLETQMKKRIDEIGNNLDSEWNKLNKAKKLWEVLRGRA